MTTESKSAPAGLTADAVYKDYVAAIGGEKALAALKTLKMTSTSELQSYPLVITVIKTSAGQFKEAVDATVNGNKMTFQKQSFDGKKGYNETQGQKKDMTADEIEDAKEEADLQSDLHPEKYGIKRTLKGMETIEGADVYVLEAVDKKDKKTVEYYDTKTGLKVRETEYLKGEDGGMVPKTTDFSDYREVPGANGYKVPYFESIPAGGTMTLNVKVQSVEVNKDIPGTEFN